jgi:transcriptional regulator with XRE-family HTH domain
MSGLPKSIDKQVGGRVRTRRLLVGLTQTKLGNAIEVTYRQVQKYENGANQISASRLQQIARALGVPLAYFFDGAPTGDDVAPGFAEPSGNSNPIAFVSSRDGVHLSRAFALIRNPEVRNKFLLLVEALAEDSRGDFPADPRHVSHAR